MIRSIFTLYSIIQFSFILCGQNSSSNLFENSHQICYNQIFTANNLNANSNNTTLNLNFDSLISCFDITKSTWYKFNTNEFGGNAQLKISSIECTGDSNLLYQSQLQAAVFSYTGIINNSNFFLLDSSLNSDNHIFFDLNNLLPNHIYYLIINEFSIIDTLQLNSICSFNIEIKGSAVKPHFSAGIDIFTLPNSMIQLNAYGSGIPTWSPSYLFDSVNSFNPIISLEKTTELLLTLEEFNNCIYLDRLKVFIELPIDINNIITPNNDGYNDNWVIDNIDNYPLCRVSIYDIFGLEVFSSVGYNEYQRWDGTKNGLPLASGTYFYIINLGSSVNNIIHKGSITLLK